VVGKREGCSQSGRCEFDFALVCRATEIGAGKRQKYSLFGRVAGKSGLDVGVWAPRRIGVEDCGLSWMCCQEEAVNSARRPGGVQGPKMDQPANRQAQN
jgi:hypothetical protein